jgi:hypothetical protein
MCKYDLKYQHASNMTIIYESIEAFNNNNNNNKKMNTTESSSTNAFLLKCFDRIYGLLAIIVTDGEGTILLKGVSPNLSQLTQVPQVKDFDGTFPAKFLFASEQASKLPYGKNEHMISFYDNFIVVQMDTSESTSTSSTNNNNNNNNNNRVNNNKNNRKEEVGGENEDREEEQDILTITLIATPDASVQLILNMGPTFKQIFGKL